MSHKDDCITAAKKAGYPVLNHEIAGSGHLRFKLQGPTKIFTVTTSATPSDNGRTMKNFIAQVKREDPFPRTRKIILEEALSALQQGGVLEEYRYQGKSHSWYMIPPTVGGVTQPRYGIPANVARQALKQLQDWNAVSSSQEANFMEYRFVPDKKGGLPKEVILQDQLVATNPNASWPPPPPKEEPKERPKEPILKDQLIATMLAAGIAQAVAEQVLHLGAGLVSADLEQDAEKHYSEIATIEEQVAMLKGFL